MKTLALMFTLVQSDAPTTANFYEAMGAAVAFAQQHVNSVQRERLSSNELMVNLRSLAALGSTTTRQELAERDIAAALGIPTTSTSTSQAIACLDSPRTPGCPRNAIAHVDFNGVLWLYAEVEVIMTIHWRSDSSRRRHLDMITHRLTLSRSEGQWKVQKDVVVSQS